MPDGIDTIMLATAKNESPIGGMPTAKKWWTHTPNDKIPMAMNESATMLYATIGRRANVTSTADTTPSAGVKMM